MSDFERWSLVQLEEFVRSAFPTAVVYINESSSFVDPPQPPLPSADQILERAESDDDNEGFTDWMGDEISDRYEFGDSTGGHVEDGWDVTPDTPDEFIDDEYIPSQPSLHAALYVLYAVDTSGRGALISADHFGRVIVDGEPQALGWGNLPIDSVPMSERIDPDWAVEAIRSRLPLACFWEDEETKLLFCDLGLVSSKSGGFRLPVGDELIVIEGTDDPWYLDADRRHEATAEILDIVDADFALAARDMPDEDVIAALAEQFEPPDSPVAPLDLDALQVETTAIGSGPVRDVVVEPGALLRSIDAGLEMASTEDLGPDGTRRLVDALATLGPHFRRMLPFMLALTEAYRTVPELVEQGESGTLEFKETARFSVRAGKPMRDIEDAVVKTVAGFLNTDGGILLIGVSDSGELVGLMPDLKLYKGNVDRYMNWMNGLVVGAVGEVAASTVQIAMEVGICRIDVPPSTQPVPSRMSDGTEAFYTRVGNSTRKLEPSQFLKHLRDRYPRGVEPLS